MNIPATIFQEAYAWLLTLGYVVILFSGFLVRPAPFGEWARSEHGKWECDTKGDIKYHSLKLRFRHPIRWLLQRNILDSQQLGMPPGLQFRFRYRHTIEVRPHGQGCSFWQHADGRALPPEFEAIRELLYLPDKDDREHSFKPSLYTIIPR